MILGSPTHDVSHGWVRTKPLGVVRVLVASETTVDGLA